MKINTIRKIDRFAGWFICLILRIHYSIFGFFKKADNAPPKNILLIKYFGMGSVILAQAAVAAIKCNFPGAKIHFLTFSGNKDVLRLFDNVDSVLSVDLRPLSKFFLDNLRMVIFLRRERMDIAYNLEFFSRFTSIMTYLSGAKRRIEFYSEVLWRGDLYTHGVKFNPYFHVRDNFLRLAMEGCVKTDKDISVAPKITGPMIKQSTNILEANNVTGNDRKVCVNVNAGELALERRWPAEYFIALINKLPETGIKYIFISDRDCLSYTNAVISQINKKNIVNLAGKTSILELAGIFHESDLLITNDSGPLHLANAIGLPVVSFFGPETPVLYGPEGDNNLVFYSGLICSPCLNVLNAKTVVCTDNNRCMISISPDSAYEAILKKYHDIFGANA